MSTQRRTSFGVGGYGNRVLISDLHDSAPREVPDRMVKAASQRTRYGIGGAGNVVSNGNLLPSTPRTVSPSIGSRASSHGIGGYGNISTSHHSLENPYLLYRAC
jgi:hypothetical protein